MTIKILALFGKAGSGKDTICKHLCSDFGVNKLIRITTRPKRQHEANGVEYFFADQVELSNRLLLDTQDFLEVGIFNDWIYATTIDQLKEGWNITTCDIDAVRQMLDSTEFNKIEIYPIYIQASDKTRLLRALNREESPNVKEIIRRYQSDESDYRLIDFDYISIENSGSFNLNNIIQILIKNNIDLKK